MWWSARQADIACLLTVLAVLGCGEVVPHGGKVPGSKPRARVVEGADLLPADLDLVVRVDVAKMRATLDADEAAELRKKAFEGSKLEGIARRALADAAVVWIALRVADFQSGDRVLVVHTARGAEVPQPDSLSWTKMESAIEGVERYEAKSPPLRGSTTEIVRVGDRDTLFVSTVEAMSVRRVLRNGPDPERGQPAARGVLSLDYRAGKPSADLRNRYPSLAKLLSGVSRVEAVVEVNGQQLQLEGRIRCKDERSAKRVALFFATIRDAGSERAHIRSLLEGMTVKRAESTVQLRWPMPRSAVIALLRRSADRNTPLIPVEKPAPPDATPAESLPAAKP